MKISVKDFRRLVLGLLKHRLEDRATNQEGAFEFLMGTYSTLVAVLGKDEAHEYFPEFWLLLMSSGRIDAILETDDE